MTEGLTPISAGGAEWRQPRTMERRFELHDGERLAATLEFRSAFGTLATATTHAGTWTFKRTGFLSPRVTVRAPGADADLATYDPRFWGNGGVLTFADGATLTWRATSFWGTSWAFVDGTAIEVVTFNAGVPDSSLKDIFKTQATIAVRTGTVRPDRIPLLLALGFYLLILHRQDAAAATAAASS